MAASTRPGPIAATPDLQQQARVLAHKLRSAPAPSLLLEDHECSELPPALAELLRQALEELSRGRSVQLLATGGEMTTQQAADYLNVSRPYLIRLLDRGELPFRRTGTHRRLRIEDVERYRARRSARRAELLHEMVQEAEEQGMYGKGA
ncbi:MAG: helix-turn-helix domain-containing protein [Hyphomicrobiales bacterium]